MVCTREIVHFSDIGYFTDVSDAIVYSAVESCSVSGVIPCRAADTVEVVDYEHGAVGLSVMRDAYADCFRREAHSTVVICDYLETYYFSERYFCPETDMSAAVYTQVSNLCPFVKYTVSYTLVYYVSCRNCCRFKRVMDRFPADGDLVCGLEFTCQMAHRQRLHYIITAEPVAHIFQNALIYCTADRKSE